MCFENTWDVNVNVARFLFTYPKCVKYSKLWPWVLLCNHTCVTSPVNCPLAIWDISVWFWVSVQSTSEDGFHLLSLSSLILQPGTGTRVRPQVHTAIQLLRKHNWYSRCWLTSALVLGSRPALRCTSGGFSPVSRGKARGNFPVSSCRGHSLASSY